MRLSNLLCASALILTTTIAPAFAIQCVPYAREVSGIKLKGDAWQWWNAAAGVYERGKNAKTGAVLVFSRQGSMRHGHVSVVTRVISSRLVLVDHANWAPVRGAGRGEITQAVPVLDVSPKNDWTQVRVWFRPTGDYGSRAYKGEGFVYNTGMSAHSTAFPQIESVALARAAAIVPTDKTLARYAEAGSASRTEPAVKTAAIQPAAVKSHPAEPIKPAEAAIVKVAASQPAAEGKNAHSKVSDFIFN